MTESFSKVDAALEAIARGEVVIVVDAEDRENEGDFICAAEKVTPEIVNFMITHGRGQLCMPLLPEVCERLKLHPDGRVEHRPLGHFVYRAGRSSPGQDRHHGPGAGA